MFNSTVLQLDGQPSTERWNKMLSWRAWSKNRIPVPLVSRQYSDVHMHRNTDLPGQKNQLKTYECVEELGQGQIYELYIKKKVSSFPQTMRGCVKIYVLRKADNINTVNSYASPPCSSGGNVHGCRRLDQQLCFIGHNSASSAQSTRRRCSWYPRKLFVHPCRLSWV